MEASSTQLLAEFLVFLGAELQLSRHTVAAYRRDLRRFLRGHQRPPQRVAITAHLRSLRGTHASASVVRALAAIRGFYRFLYAEGWTTEDISAGLLGTRREQKLPPVLSRRAVESLLATATVAGDGDGDGDVDLADYLLMVNCLGNVVSPECGGFDIDKDGDVDLSDLVKFQTLFTGSR